MKLVQAPSFEPFDQFDSKINLQSKKLVTGWKQQVFLDLKCVYDSTDHSALCYLDCSGSIQNL